MKVYTLYSLYGGRHIHFSIYMYEECMRASAPFPYTSCDDLPKVPSARHRVGPHSIITHLTNSHLPGTHGSLNALNPLTPDQV